MDFRSLPKIELHARLTGSINRNCLHEIWARKKRSGETTLEDPLIEMPTDKFDYVLETRVHVLLRFFPLFSKYIYGLCDDLPSISYATDSVVEDFCSDGVVYLELRTTPRAVPRAKITKDDYIKVILDRMRDGLVTGLEVVDLARNYQGSGLIVGVDLCEDPTVGDVPIFRPAFQMARELGLKTTIHFTEVPQSSTTEELQTLLSYMPDRLGHVIHVAEDIKTEILRRNLGLELCLSCNIHVKMATGTFADHHFGYWRQTKCPITICTDDVGIFCSRLSDEYALAANHFGLNYDEICKLARSPIDIIFGNEDEKRRLRSIMWD